MRIDDDDRKIGRDKRMDLIRRYQDEQAKLDQGDKGAAKPGKPSSSEELRALAKAAEKADADSKVDQVKAGERKHDVQATELNRDLVRTQEARHVTGAERSTEAVDAAHKQQMRGENWQKLSDAAKDGVPESVDEKARAEKAQLEKAQLEKAQLETQEVERQEKERLSVRELQNDLAIKGRMIRS